MKVLEDVLLEQEWVTREVHLTKPMLEIYLDLKGDRTDQEFIGHLLYLHEKNV